MTASRVGLFIDFLLPLPTEGSQGPDSPRPSSSLMTEELMIMAVADDKVHLFRVKKPLKAPRMVTRAEVSHLRVTLTRVFLAQVWMYSACCLY